LCFLKVKQTGASALFLEATTRIGFEFNIQKLPLLTSLPLPVSCRASRLPICDTTADGLTKLYCAFTGARYICQGLNRKIRSDPFIMITILSVYLSVNILTCVTFCMPACTSDGPILYPRILHRQIPPRVFVQACDARIDDPPTRR